ncbi:hypothetical protein QN386_24755 [Pseudomonas sp. CCI3.2]|uniref:hypothetical protein n=1 Tax=unclassified Pseudomonas TaxID=196821 RepID=UPI002AC8F3FC|nr:MULTISPECIES: hypothetical protein [unclassified Pseudomonas]MEB0078482.1 hypothetical protein [Pseudomonas sp. MH10out]MEB0090112.1 hypothetical protein [Pseudomonas sp. CCI4.2]MEB0104518.1 hypothetical protein [Pseudomonas sp. CCI3.2]MEB0131735.1 hypothetical protein [Pseudomonas sp. CCI2.4]MEB0158105.1 hypothetical protein [Pseudomonas sp. AH2 (2023)]
MRMLIGALTLVLLAGCVSPSMDSARTTTPAKTFTSEKKEDLVAQCIQFAWQDELMFGVEADAYLKPGTKGGFMVYTRSAEYFVDVQSAASGTTVNYFVAKGDALAERRLASLATCL